MRFTEADKQQMARVKERATKKQHAHEKQTRDIADVSDSELAEITPELIACMKGVKVCANTLRARIFRGMAPRQAATMPPMKPQRPKPTQEHKHRWNNM